MKVLLLLVTMCMAQYEESYILLGDCLKECAFSVQTMREHKLEIVKIDVDLIGTTNYKTVTKVMSSNFSYIVGVVGDMSRIAEIETAVIFGGEIVSTTEIRGKAAVATLSPKETGEYIIVVKALRMKPGYEEALGYFSLVVAHD